ncbi:MAG: hypothetical protein ABSA91_15430 [Acidimicrobiales bacterium]
MNRLWTRRAKVSAPLAVFLSTSFLGVSALATSSYGPAASAQVAATATFSARPFASGAHISHATAKGEEPISQPDDITFLRGDIFVGFQNGVGPQGQASSDGNLDSTVVEFNLAGVAVGQWDVVGKCDGLTADTATGQVIATVNEDAHSSIYLLDPATASVVHYRYNEALPSKGGTDAISIYHGMVLISASAPGTTGKAAPQPTYPAVYRATFDAGTGFATVHPLFFDEAPASVASTTGALLGPVQHLALTDPDSNEDVPAFAPRFAGDFMLTSQGDKEQIFVHDAGTSAQSLSVLGLSGSVDDTAWASDRTGAIYTTDNSDNTVYKITGPFRRGEVFVAATPCDADNAPATCPAPGFPPNYLGQLDPATGAIARVSLVGPAVAAQGMLFLP